MILEMRRLPLWVSAAVLWVGMAVLAIANGALRQFVYGPWLGERGAQVVAGVIFIPVVIALIGHWVYHWAAPASLKAFGWVGLGWMLATDTFEIAMLHMNSTITAPWTVYLQQHDPTTGNLWLLLLFAVLIAPVFWARRYAQTSSTLASASTTPAAAPTDKGDD